MLDALVNQNCIASLFSEEPTSCFKKSENTKSKQTTNKIRNAGLDLISRGSGLRKAAKDPKRKPDLAGNWKKENIRDALGNKRIHGGTSETGLWATSHERRRNTLAQYPWLCSLKTR